MIKNALFILFFFLFLLHLVQFGAPQPPPPPAAPTPRLESLHVHPELISLSGFGSGGAFAQQLYFSYSSLFHGLALFSSTFYRCGGGDGILANYNSLCSTLGNLPRSALWDPTLALIDIENYFRQGLIEDPRNLRHKKLYVFAGTRNWLYSAEQSLQALDIYEPLIRSNHAIRTRVRAANLTLPSNTFGGSCAGDSTPTFFISNCDLSAPFEALSFLLGRGVSRLPNVNSPILLQPLRTFDQTEFFFGSQERYEMDTLGFIYIPSRCTESTCLLHFYFHGCAVGREFVGDSHVRNSGFLEVAELNNIVLVFPQVVSNTVTNPAGCWDTFGHTGPLFATQRGSQVSAVRNMLARILGEDPVRLPPTQVDPPFQLQGSPSSLEQHHVAIKSSQNMSPPHHHHHLQHHQHHHAHHEHEERQSRRPRSCDGLRNGGGHWPCHLPPNCFFPKHGFTHKNGFVCKGPLRPQTPQSAQPQDFGVEFRGNPFHRSDSP